MDMVRWGVVSAGRISHTFVKDMSYVSTGVVTAVAARDLDKAKAFAQQYKIEKAYQGYDALFNDADIDAVYISTPHTLHFEHAKQALLAGKHVLCEKPFTVTPEQTRELTELAKRQGLFLMEAMWTYFLPAIKKAKTWVEQGRIGQLRHIKADFGYPLPYDPDRREWDASLGGGCLLEMGIYPLSLNYLFNPSCQFDIAVVGRRAANGADRDVSLVFDYGDSVSTLNTTFDCRLPNWAFIVGTEGYIAIPDFFRASECSLFKIDELIDHFNDERMGSGFEFEIAAANKAIQAGELISDDMPLKTSLYLQTLMSDILKRF